jgi:predicted nucleotidyltransferase component of viral defense system
MIPKSDIISWSKKAPWKNDYLVEQDLIIERTLIEIYSNPELNEQLAFRGGTALHKLYFDPQPRYSEDIDLVQITSGPIGDILSLLREKLSFLGRANYEHVLHSNKLIYSFQTEFEPVVKLKVKIEINTREHFTVYGYNELNRKVESEWFTGECKIKTFTVEELLGTKLRALFQRSKGRDLFDIWYSHENSKLNIANIINSFHSYLGHDNLHISRSEFVMNMEEKILDKEFNGDITGLLRPGIEYNVSQVWPLIKERIINQL